MSGIRQWVAGEQARGDRNYQEDDFSISLLSGARQTPDDARLLLVLADGMGGHAGGAVAGKTVVRAFRQGFERAAGGIAERLGAGIETANNAVREQQRADPRLSEMGSTLLAALVDGPVLYWASVGDSILWLFRRGGLQRLNADHSMKPLLLDLVELGRMTEAEALSDARANQLRSAIFGAEVPLIDMHAEGVALQDGDVVLLASDGLETLPEQAITAVISAVGGDAGGLVDALLDAVTGACAPGQDNTTVLAYRVGRGRASLQGALAGTAAAQRQAVFEQQTRPCRTDEVQPRQAGKAAPPRRRLIARLMDALAGPRGNAQ